MHHLAHLVFCPSSKPPTPTPTPSPFFFFLVPRVVAVSPQMRLVEDNPSSLSLVEIYKQRCAKKGIEHDNPISRYYDRLATVQARGTQASHQVWRTLKLLRTKKMNGAINEAIVSSRLLLMATRSCETS